MGHNQKHCVSITFAFPYSAFGDVEIFSLHILNIYKKKLLEEWLLRMQSEGGIFGNRHSIYELMSFKKLKKKQKKKLGNFKVTKVANKTMRETERDFQF